MLLTYLFRFLCNTSGSGKTRLIFEGFVRHWGIYFTARTQPDGVGSSDLENIVDSLASQGKLVEIKEENRSTIEPRNKRVASHWLQAFIYARLFVFRLFLECAQAQPGGIVEEHKQLWLFMQVAPTSFFGSDVFLSFSQIIGDSITTGLDGAIALERTTITEILGPSTAIYTALDETQILTNKFREFFLSEQDPTQPRPILRILFPFLIPLRPLIVAGTGLSMHDLGSIYSSVIAKEGPEAEIFTDLGAFETQEDQRLYIEHYLPKGFLTVELAGRIGYWLHGR
jgi:hypothetical protein